MIEATLIISIPIFLSWFTTLKKQRLKAQLLCYDEEVQELESQLDELTEISRRRATERRFFDAKRDALEADIQTCRQELQELRQAPRTMAA